MQILDPTTVANWLRIDENTEATTLDLLEASAIAQVSHLVGTDILATGYVITPSIEHAVYVLVAAHFDQRVGSHEDTMRTVKALCQTAWVPRL